MIYKSLVIIFVIFIFPAFGCHPHEKQNCSIDIIETNETYTYVNKIVDSMAGKFKSGIIEFPFTLHEDNDFNTIICNPCQYKSALIKLITDTLSGNLSKLIALYELQHLCIDDYQKVLRIIYEEYENMRVDENFLMTAVNQGGFSLEVCKNYKKELLRQLLKSIQTGLKSEENKVYIGSILSGSCWSNSRDYYAGSKEQMPWTCE